TLQVRRVVVRAHAEAYLRIALGPRHIPRAEQQHAQIVEGIRKIWLKLQGSLQIFSRLSKIILVGKEHRQAINSFRVVRGELDRALERCLRILGPSDATVEVAQVEVRNGAPRVLLN